MVTDEHRAADFVTHGMLSVSLLELLTRAVYSGQCDTMTIKQFYDSFQQTHQSQRFRPFNEGVLLAFMYLGVLFVKENWSDLIPKADLSIWGISPRRLFSPKKPNPSLFDLVRRVRNSLGHGSPTIVVPSGTTPTNIASQVTVAFRDENPCDPADVFEVELSLEQALHVAKMLHKTVLENLSRREQAT